MQFKITNFCFHVPVEFACFLCSSFAFRLLILLTLLNKMKFIQTDKGVVPNYVDHCDCNVMKLLTLLSFND
jgi:hypothetical protein